MTRKASHLYGLLAFFDPLLSRAPFVVETHHAPAGCLQVGHDESDSGEQLPEVELHFRHYSTRCLPARGLVEEALVPHHGLVAGSSHWPRQQLRAVALQAQVYPRKALAEDDGAQIGIARFPRSIHQHRLRFQRNRLATGLTFFDDDVTNFFSPHAKGKNVIFLLAIGKPQKRKPRWGFVEKFVAWVKRR